MSNYSMDGEGITLPLSELITGSFVQPPTTREQWVYLAGPISGCTFAGADDWRKGVAAQLPEHIKALSPMRAKDYLREDPRIGDSYAQFVLSTQAGITSRDRRDVMTSDLVIFNFLGAEKASIGTCIELGWADAFRKPGILVIEDESNVHDHAMVRQICGWRVNSLEQAVAVATAILTPGA